jgi:hypothetical protein
MYWLDLFWLQVQMDDTILEHAYTALAYFIESQDDSDIFFAYNYVVYAEWARGNDEQAGRGFYWPRSRA